MKRIGRESIQVNINSPQEGHVPVYDYQTRLWNTLPTSSFLSNSSSYAETASFAPNYLPLTGGTITGDVTLLGTASISFLNVSYESASVIYSSGSNQFGDATDDVQTLIGTVIVSGSQTISGSLFATSITGSLFGTASWALNSFTSSTSISSSHALTSSYVNQLNQSVIISGSLSVSGSIGTSLFSTNADTIVFTGSLYHSGSVIATGSINVTEITSSLFGTSSWAQNAVSASYVDAGNVVGLSLFRLSTGSISASLSTNDQNLFLINSGSKTYVNVAKNGNTDVYSDFFVIKSFVNESPVFTVSQSIAKFATQSSVPTAQEEVGAVWFTSTDVYVSLN